MSQEEYEAKLKNVRRFIPFLENMITQLRDPKAKNREQQLSKMESLYQMITDTNKKLKLETLQKCDEVIIKLYHKVKGEHANLPPPYPTDRKEEKRKPINLYSIAGESINKQKSGSADDGGNSSRSKSFANRKPPISYSDLECLEKDVAHQLEKKMSLNELNSLRNRLCKELEDSNSKPSDQINTTVRNKPVLMRMNAASPDKNKRKSDTPAILPKNEPKKELSHPKKIDNKPIVLKEAGDMFCSAFSEIDKTYEAGLKKKEEKKCGKDKKDAIIEDVKERLALKLLSDKAALLRGNLELKSSISASDTPGKEENGSNAEIDETNRKKDTEEKCHSNVPVAAISSRASTSLNSDSSADKANVGGTPETIPLNIPLPKSSNKNRPVIGVEMNLSDIPLPQTEYGEDDKQNKSNDISKEDNSKTEKINVDKPPSNKPDYDKSKKDKSHSSRDSSTKDKKQSDSKRDKNEKSNKPEHKKDRNDRTHKSDHKKDKDDRSRDRNRDRSEKRHEDKNKEKNSKDPKLNEIVDSGKDKKPSGDSDKCIKEVAKIGDDKKKGVDDVLKKIHNEIDHMKEVNIDELSKKIDEVIKAKPVVPEIPLLVPQPIINKIEEPRSVSRDPRLKIGVLATSNTTPNIPIERLATKYNPKPKRPNTSTDIDKSVVDSIEKSMKESSMSFLSPKLSTPNTFQNDLFSPESPNEIDKVAVPPILNDLLLNPKTTGVINEVVSALRRSNNEKFTSDLSLPMGNQTPKMHFSPPIPPMQFDPPPMDSPVYAANQVISKTIPFNPLSPTYNKEIERHLPRNQLHYEPPSQNLNQYDDRNNQGFYVDRTQNFVQPSSTYVAPSFIPPSPSYVPPSPSYVPPSPLYENNADTFRDMNYQNFQSPNQQRFYEGERTLVRPKGLLGDAPTMFPYNQQYGQNTHNYNRFGQRGSNNIDARNAPYFARMSRDPRINVNRDHPFPSHEIRPIVRESRMTYREYKEQRELREKEAMEKEQREKEVLEKMQRERSEAEQKTGNQNKEIPDKDRKENEKEKPSREKESDDKEKDGSRRKDSGRSKTRDRSKERYQRNRSPSRYKRDRDVEDRRNRVDRSREKSRYDSKFDKAYSVKEKHTDESPLNIFSSKSTKGKSYGSFKIPKKAKQAENPKEVPETKEGKTENDKPAEKKQETECTKEENEETHEPPVEENKLSNEANCVLEVKKEIPKVEIENSPVKPDIIIDKIEEEAKPKNEPEVDETSTSKPETKDDKDDKPVEKKEEEENILSKFFTNLMKSGNKDEKKGALLSLISTFSDSFSDQQLQKITKIIRSEDVDEEPVKEAVEDVHKEKETEKKEESQTESEEAEKELEKIESESEKIKSESDKVETESEKIEDESESHVMEEETPVDDAPNLRTTRSRVKNRRKSEVPKPETKCKTKCKSELDKLHDDIREMFIRDGVVTATGKRMCRILKDSSGSPSTETDRTEDEPVQEESEKKSPQQKKRVKRMLIRKAKENAELEMKELTVVLPKMSLEKMKEPIEREREEESWADHEENHEHSDDEASDKESVEKSNPIKKVRKRNRNSWASGVIKKKPGPKSRKNKAADTSTNKSEDREIEDEVEANEEPVIEENFHDVDYYMKTGQKSLQCKYCDVSTKWIAAHYKSEHPNKEVLSSRLPPSVAKKVIEDAIKNKDIYDTDEEISHSKHDFICLFCCYNQNTLPKFYHDHVSIHTGEFRHKCPYCNFSRSHSKTMISHVAEVHAAEESVSKKPMASARAQNNRNVYGYLCQICNFTQMKLETLEKHVKTFHTKKCNIYKIKMNQAEKIEEEKVVEPRTTRRSRKANQSLDEENVPLSETSEISEEVEEKKSESQPVDFESSTTELDDESSTEVESTSKTRRQTRKRGSKFSEPSPVKKRLKRRCTMGLPPSKDTSEEVQPEDSEDKPSKSVDEAVFTSNTDIQEENKRIEEERMKTMQDINSTIKLRTSLDFVEKLSHRLKQEEEVVVKQEEEDDAENPLEKLPVSDLPVFEKSVSQSTPARPEITAKPSAKDSERVNPVNGVIEKLQGILGSASGVCDDVASPTISNEDSPLPPLDANEDLLPSVDPVNDSSGPPSLEIAIGGVIPKLEPVEPNLPPPPLIHMDTIDRSAEKSSMINSETLNIGLVKVMKTSTTYIYVCCVPPCIFSSRDRTAFANHCQVNHRFDHDSPQTTQCLYCKTTITSGDDFNILVSTFHHLIHDHSDFFGVKIGSIRICSNLFPEQNKRNDDCPLTPPTISIPSPPEGHPNDDLDALLDVEQPVEPVVEENDNKDEGDNPFAFKIVNVMSLADDNFESSSTTGGTVDPEHVEEESGLPVTQESTSHSGLATSSPHLLKYQAMIKPISDRKSPAALKKFLGNHFDLYKCPDYVCLFTTNKRKMFDIHLKMHPKHKIMTNCLYCDQVISFDGAGAHYEKFHGMCRFSCAYCLYRCIAKDYMDVHQVLSHPEMPSRMQLLPKRDVEEKNLMLLTEVTKSIIDTSQPYICCSRQFLKLMSFTKHLETCPNKTNLMCFHRNANQVVCSKTHDNVQELVTHWGTAHGVYPIKCAYCNFGDFDLNTFMVHLVLEHPTLPPDIIDRYQAQTNKTKKPPAFQCNFKKLAAELRSGQKPSHTELPLVESTPVLVVPSIASSTPPHSMQKAFEHFVLTSPTTSKSTALTRVAPVSILQKSPPSIALLTPTSKSNMLNAGGIVYCLSPGSTNQNAMLKAIVVNNPSDKTPPPRMQLVAPVTPPKDKKFQIVSKIMPLPTSHNLPRLTPLNVTSTGKVVQTCVVTAMNASTGVEKAAQVDEAPDVADNEKEDVAVVDVVDIDNLDEPMVVIQNDSENKDCQDDVDPLSLEIDESPVPEQAPKSPSTGPVTPLQEYDSDFKEVDQQEVMVQTTGLVGPQLYRCAKCEMFFAAAWQFKKHLMSSERCLFVDNPQKPYKCYHCSKSLKHYSNLLDHLGYHGRLRITCSLCNRKFPHPNQARYHMKTQHNVQNIQMQPLANNKSNIMSDSFIAKPLASVKQTVKETITETDAQKPGDVKTVYFSFEADQIPQKSILGYDITCGHCMKFKNKVRSNIVRHLLLHQNDKDLTVPDVSPVNPVPCLEKNEKMFDKMYNLASSSHTGGRMGGQQKGETSKDKVNDTNYPAFVPLNKRFQCCCVGCNYLCLEEGNLRHHLTALHMEDLSFVCVHCKKDLSDAVDVDTIIKHLKLHELHLYKCGWCDFMHNLRHKIERHIAEDHKNKESTVVVIRAMDAEPFDDNQQQPFAPATVNQKVQKPWRCCMCKYKCQTEEDAVNHAKNKHNIDCRYKCALCTFKANDVLEFKGHFTSDHPECEIDIISAYDKEDEAGGAVSENEQFDTTPLWLRDKPRVRHIRGILFEEDTTTKKKTALVKATSTEQTVKEPTGTATSKKRKRSVSTLNESTKSEAGYVEMKKEALEPQKNFEKVTAKNDDVIVIDDDEKETSLQIQDQPEAPVDNDEVSDVDLICMYGDFGMPLNKHFKCPKCEKYRTTKMRDFVQHVTGELRYYRFLCTICNEKFITLENIQMHCIDYHDCSVKSVSNLPVDKKINKWLTLLLTEQRNIIKGLGFACDDIPDQIEDFLGSLEITSNKPIKCKECGFSVSGPTALDRHMKYNHPHVAFSRNPHSSQQAEKPRPASVASDKKRRSEDTSAGPSEPKKLKTVAAKTNLLAKDKYVCIFCSSEYNSVPEMEYHGKEVHRGLVEYTTKTTDLPISYSGGARNIFRCRYCQSTGTKSSMEVHITMAHPGQKLDLYRFSCGVCAAKFEVLKSFRQHFKSHNVPNMFYYDVHDRRVELNALPNAKQKIYKCPVCSYFSTSVNSNLIKQHLKIHAKPFQCDLCRLTFKTKSEAKIHHTREHPHNNECISTIPEMLNKVNLLMDEVTKTVKPVIEETNTMHEDEEDVSSLPIQPEVILRTDDDSDMEIEVTDPVPNEGARYFARKSTGLNIKQDETKEYYSFYGQKPEPVDMKKITTNFEIADAKMTMSCDQLGRIYNLKPIIRLKDCMTMIIDDDDDTSS